ncbi:MAG: hypothetical protein ACK5HT_16510 [Draconibacterium sp.]
MKTRMNHFAAIAIFAIIIFAGNVNAHENKAKASSHEALTETSLQIENWMTDEHVWNVQAAPGTAREAEAELKVESWMTDQKAWELAYLAATETEAQLTLEDWMMNNTYWKI